MREIGRGMGMRMARGREMKGERVGVGQAKGNRKGEWDGVRKREGGRLREKGRENEDWVRKRGGAG